MGELKDTDTVYCRKVGKKRSDFPKCYILDDVDCFNCTRGD